jgi:hypothetical protein
VIDCYDDCIDKQISHIRPPSEIRIESEVEVGLLWSTYELVSLSISIARHWNNLR